MSTSVGHGRHEVPEEAAPPQGIWAEFKDAVALRTVALIVGVLLLQLGFVLSYVGAFHAPTPKNIPLAVVSSSAQASDQVAAQLNVITGTPLRATVVTDRETAERQIRNGELSAALLVDPQGTADTLLTSSGGGVSVSGAVTSVIDQVEAAQKRTVTVTDIVPLQGGDGRGLTGFYLVIGWLVGGYLVASLLGVAAGARPATPRRAWFRLIAIVPYAIVSGLGGALIVDQVLGALTGHFMSLWWLGALLVASAAAATMAFQVLFGVIGIGITVLVFVVLGNPSAGGAYQTTLLPPFWRALSNALPNGAGTDAVRRIVYLGSNGITGHLVVIAIYAVAGAAVAIAGSHLIQRRSLRADGTQALA
ncbi:hypothetical protein SAMN04515671_1272 [Nakamurella panacisegetis]|uniref:Uncharacterized protein n=1 Tax=Nakamurella panacisegetis TaxID=1090615 RepID=A0A1H0KED8_9ACTN|nr:DUF3533 domain-containing protein [Nakamurella panacisegetis]SDO54206.1 hypothetical protein SAMN04515671_1272 [Nakamurella panacisegetis]